MQPPDSDTHDRPGHSTGPRSPAGKARSSRNSLRHGCCSQVLILPEESEAAFNELKERWIIDYQPHTETALNLVLEAIKAYWFMLRAQRWHDRIQEALIEKQEDPLHWTEEDHKKLERFARYRTAAERAFHRAFNDLEQLRKTRLREAMLEIKLVQSPPPVGAGHARPDASSRHASSQSTPVPSKNAIFDSRDAKKNLRKIPILDQWAEITVEDGQTVTRLYPSNEDLIKEGQAMDPPPQLVYRRFNFVNGVPSEYRWATSDALRCERGGFATQRMTVDTWLETIERETNAGTGHLGPCGKPLPRPKERGECDCPLCLKLSES